VRDGRLNMEGMNINDSNQESIQRELEGLVTPSQHLARALFVEKGNGHEQKKKGRGLRG